MRSSYRSFGQRLEALERLEAEAAAARGSDEGPPDVDTMDDIDVLMWTIDGMRSYCLLDGRGGLSRQIVVRANRIRTDRWQKFYDALAPRAQQHIDASPYPFIPLFADEIEQAIALIDAGRCDAPPSWVSAADPWSRGSFYHLRLDGNTGGDAEGEAIVKAVNYAVALWAWQLGHPQMGAWEMTTAAEYRAWLVALQEAPVAAPGTAP
jgi:hypothetical protein